MTRWDLLPDGEPVHTPTSDLLPVRSQGQAAMLKVARNDEEEVGHGLMVWWSGAGAARVLAHAGPALLLERVGGGLPLTELVRRGHDDEASRILCRVAARLHAPRPEPAPALVPLERWFRALEPASRQYGGVLVDGAATARHLLSAPQDPRPLHGDLHHANVLHSPERGWLAIDPKGLTGERGFDYANIFCNPDLPTASRPGRLARQSWVVAQAAGLDRHRLLEWVLAYAGLSAAWHLEDGRSDLAAPVLEVARLAAAEGRR
nr:aminoglycoside phosphotransferase family protein [Deinococcus budaensis]